MSIIILYTSHIKDHRYIYVRVVILVRVLGIEKSNNISPLLTCSGLVPSGGLTAATTTDTWRRSKAS